MPQVPPEKPQTKAPKPTHNNNKTPPKKSKQTNIEFQDIL